MLVRIQDSEVRWGYEEDVYVLYRKPAKHPALEISSVCPYLSARPHEILGIKIKEVIFKSVDNQQYLSCVWAV